MITKKEKTQRIRRKIKAKSNRLRLSVFRSNKFIYGQIIDDEKGETLVSVSPKDLKSLSGNKISQAEALGEALGKKASKKGIKKVVFDRGGYLYHGRVKAFAQGARKAGLEF